MKVTEYLCRWITVCTMYVRMNIFWNSKFILQCNGWWLELTDRIIESLLGTCSMLILLFFIYIKYTLPFWPIGILVYSSSAGVTEIISFTNRLNVCIQSQSFWTFLPQTFDTCCRWIVLTFNNDLINMLII